ncbi:MAG: ABC transporter ATP-binding protein [Erysipelotrichaceae bacterium]
MQYAIEMLNITKDFPGIRANDNINLQVEKGEIHALLGENGAGKSTLMSILFGLYQPTEGKILVNGQEVKISDPNVASDLGIGMVHQHFKLIDSFSVTENIILGMEPNNFGIIDIKKAAKRVKEISELYGLNVDPYVKIKDIGVGMQQRVEILKMLYRNSDILIFDEPTAVLTPQEIKELIKIMQDLTNEGKTIILITHKLKEIKAVASKCTILRKGKGIKTVSVADTSLKEMAEMMVGRTVNFAVEKSAASAGDNILEIKHLVVKNSDKMSVVNDFSLSVKAGEIVGLAGVDGNGQTELVYAITGLAKVSGGSIFLNNKDITNYSVKEKLLAGLAHVPEDRHKHGLVLDFSLEYNFILHNYNEEPYSKNGILNNKAISQHADDLIDQFDVRSGLGRNSITRTMSGGNQQKAIIAREIDSSKDLLLVVQPTRGLDVGAIEYIHSRIIAERDKGKAVLLVSLELDEIMNLSDRIAVIHNGELTGLVEADQVSENEIGLLMSGSKDLGGSDYEKE